MRNIYKISIDPTSRIYYASYYIQGLYDLIGTVNVVFDNKPFKDLKRSKDDYSFEHYFAFVVTDGNGIEIKIIIDFCDPPDIHPDAYAWCDYYGKVNLNRELTPQIDQAKVISLPPGFGIRIWNKWETIGHCLTNLFKLRFSPLVSYKRYFQDYYLQYKRPELSSYSSATQIDPEISRPYIFMIGTLWGANSLIAETNEKRRRFIEVCNNLHCDFEGGFYAEADHPLVEDYRKYLLNEAYPAQSYVEKTKKSRIVFNTPAVHNCHGWKLGEYFAMGKAILSTALSNEIPGEVRHGLNIHIIEDLNELDAAISLLLNDDNYRKTLSENAGDYFEMTASPSATIKNLLSAINIPIESK